VAGYREGNNAEHKADEGYFIEIEAEKVFSGKEM